MFILEEVCIPVVGSVGLVGNLAAIVVLSHPDMKPTFHQSLITLAVFEILLLILLICDCGVRMWSELYMFMLPYILYPLKNILMSCESFLLVSRFQLYQNFYECRCVKKIVWMGVFIRVSHFLLALNSSVNFIIYWSIGKPFKTTFSRILRKIGRRSAITSNQVDV